MQTEQISEDPVAAEYFYERASAGKRFVNYLVDVSLFYLLVFAFAVLLVLVSPDSIKMFTDESPGPGLLSRFIILVLYAIYMSVVEAVFKGKSLGKLITKTRAVNLDGSQISTNTAFERGFSRAVPFCAFSAFGNPSNPWQDRWTNTMVINEKN